MKDVPKRKNAQRPKTAPEGDIANAAFLLQLERALEARLVAKYGASAKTQIDVKFPEPAPECGCDICRESKRLDAITVYEVWTETESYVTDQAHIACAIASKLDRLVRVRTKRLPRVQYEAIQRSAQ